MDLGTEPSQRRSNMATTGEFGKWWKSGWRSLATCVRDGSGSSILPCPSHSCHPQKSTGFWWLEDPGPSQSLWVSFVQKTNLWQIIVLMCVRISEHASHLFIHSFMHVHPPILRHMKLCLCVHWCVKLLINLKSLLEKSISFNKHPNAVRQRERLFSPACI